MVRNKPATPPIGKIQPFSKIVVILEPTMQFRFPLKSAEEKEDSVDQ